VLVPGQSGHPASPFYDDQIGLWQKVRYRPMVYGREMAESAASHRLTLAPAGEPSPAGNGDAASQPSSR
jgi:penicillin amidase